MRSVLLAGVICLLLPAGAAAQRPAGPARFSLTGLVVDSLSGQPVAGATVSFRGARRIVFTDSSGRFTVQALPGAEQVQVRQIGYVTLTFQAEVGPSGAPFLLFLTPDPVPLAEITARASRTGKYTIEGMVVDSATGFPLPGVVVWFRTSGRNAITDSLGHYVFDGARAGFEDVAVNVLGYQRRTAYQPISQPWQRLDFALPPDAVVLPGLVAFARGMRHNSVRGPALTFILGERDLARSGRATPADFLASAQALPPPGPAWTTRYCTPSEVIPPGARPRWGPAGLPRGPAPPPSLTTAGVGAPDRSPAVLFVDGQRVGFTTPDGRSSSSQEDIIPPVASDDFYRAVIYRGAGCTGSHNVAILVYTKSYLRSSLRRGRRELLLPPDSIEALLARADSAR